jgi:hypothetical protein
MIKNTKNTDNVCVVCKEDGGHRVHACNSCKATKQLFGNKAKVVVFERIDARRKIKAAASASNELKKAVSRENANFVFLCKICTGRITRNRPNCESKRAIFCSVYEIRLILIYEVREYMCSLQA